MSIIHLHDAPRHCYLHAMVVHRLCRRPGFLRNLCTMVIADLDIHVSTTATWALNACITGPGAACLHPCGWVPPLNRWSAPGPDPSISTFSARGRPVFESFRHGTLHRTPHGVAHSKVTKKGLRWCLSFASLKPLLVPVHMYLTIVIS